MGLSSSPQRSEGRDPGPFVSPGWSPLLWATERPAGGRTGAKVHAWPHPEVCQVHPYALQLMVRRDRPQSALTVNTDNRLPSVSITDTLPKNKYLWNTGDNKHFNIILIQCGYLNYTSYILRPLLYVVSIYEAVVESKSTLH